MFATGVLERIVDQLAHHAVDDDFDIRIEPFGMQVCAEIDIELLEHRTFADEIADAALQSEIVEHLRRKVVRDLPQRTYRLIHHGRRRREYFTLLGGMLALCQHRHRHLDRRKQRSQTVMQFAGELGAGLLFGTQHGSQDAFVGQFALMCKAVDVVEQFADVEHSDRYTD